MLEATRFVSVAQQKKSKHDSLRGFCAPPALRATSQLEPRPRLSAQSMNIGPIVLDTGVSTLVAQNAISPPKGKDKDPPKTKSKGKAKAKGKDHAVKPKIKPGAKRKSQPLKTSIPDKKRSGDGGLGQESSPLKKARVSSIPDVATGGLTANKGFVLQVDPPPSGGVTPTDEPSSAATTARTSKKPSTNAAAPSSPSPPLSFEAPIRTSSDVKIAAEPPAGDNSLTEVLRELRHLRQEVGSMKAYLASGAVQQTRAGTDGDSREGRTTGACCDQSLALMELKETVDDLQRSWKERDDGMAYNITTSYEALYKINSNLTKEVRDLCSTVSSSGPPGLVNGIAPRKSAPGRRFKKLNRRISDLMRRVQTHQSSDTITPSDKQDADAAREILRINKQQVFVKGRTANVGVLPQNLATKVIAIMQQVSM
jgi:hypothetical protein